MPSLPFFGTESGATLSIQAHAIRAVHGILTDAINTTVSTSGPLLLPFVLHDNPHLGLADRAAPELGNRTSVNASQILRSSQRRELRYLAATTSTVSICAALCALYWFCLMRRNFRRDLVLMLIMGDFWKSLWFLAYSVSTFVNGPIKTGTNFCQAGGYLLTWGLESCDFAILFMSLHMALQIFPPKDSCLGHDGLYRLRHWVVAAWFIVPNIMASLAFINDGPAFQATGAFCTLPIRPFWYRLALSWIPRYLIWIYIMAVAIKIYRHVGREFAVFGHERDGSSSLPVESSLERSPVTDMGNLANRRKSMASSNFDLERQAIDEDDVAPGDESVSPSQSRSGSQTRFAPTPLKEPSPSLPSALGLPDSRKPSPPQWSPAFSFPADPQKGPLSPKSASSSRRGSRVVVSPGVQAEDFAPPSSSDSHTRHRPSVVTMNSVRSWMTASQAPGSPGLAPIREDKRISNSIAAPEAPQKMVNETMRGRRRAIQRQLRLLFIYPVVYMMLWVIPFVNHCFNYNDYYAQNPIFVISILNTFCQCFLGFADVCVFCWREKPWRHVPGSDGTFLGSFCFWRFWKDNHRARRESKAPSYVPSPEHTQDEKAQTQASLRGMFRRWSHSSPSGPTRPSDASSDAGAPHRIPHRRTHSGGSDKRQRQADQAHQRLALERADYEKMKKNLDNRRQSVISTGMGSPAPAAKSPARKEWWDKPLKDEAGKEPASDIDVASTQ